MYGGQLVHQTQDDYGTIQVVDFQNIIRRLHFGNKTEQSAMLLCNPYFLLHKYSQAMMLPLCWTRPGKVLLLGLGSGAVARFLYNYFPDIHIDAVELRQKVIEIAHELFLLPEDSPRLQVHPGSAFDWLAQHHSLRPGYDLIIVDMFLTTKAGKDITVDVSTELERIVNCLSDDGVAVFNHLSSNLFSYPGFDSLSALFSHQLYTLDIDATNSILLATRGQVPLTIPDPQLQQIEAHCSIRFADYFEQMQRIYE